ncbi:hypothetical protein RIF29_24468 [Crotalaria pallida]|uniref:Uncharacterized protein n=1 Tax=Crotalaria pallida TaxID=3830 RepID=A0AAN9HYX7_CROPI
MVVNLGRADLDGKNILANDIISNWPWSSVIEPDVYRRVTLMTVPVVPRTHRPLRRVLAKRNKLSTMSTPLENSMAWLQNSLGLSSVTIIDDFGLLFEPHGQFLERRVMAISTLG